MLISFVCTGNICRSPAAALVAKKKFAEAGLSHVNIVSAGTSQYHLGDPPHPNSQLVLAARGYATDNAARTLGEHERNADLIIVATSQHKRHLHQWGADPDKVKLLRSFDDYSDSLELADPYGYDRDAYELMLDQIEAAMPGIIQWAKDNGATA